MAAPTHLTLNEKNAINTLVDNIKNELKEQVIQIRLFGSKIRGKSHDDSDIDILIVVRERTQSILDTIADISLKVDLEYDVNISLIIFSIEEFDQNRIWETEFIQNIQREGVSL